MAFGYDYIPKHSGRGTHPGTLFKLEITH